MSSCLPFDPTQSLLAGMTTQQLQAALTAAQQAYLDLLTGNKGVTFSYAQGDGSRTVSYKPTNKEDLAYLIRLLQVQLGVVTRARRPLRFNFR
jgi:hypothetical protein